MPPMIAKPPDDVGLVYDDLFLAHQAPPGHPEHAGRLVAAMAGLRESGLGDGLRCLPRASLTREDAERVHHPMYLNRLEREVAGRTDYRDLDTFHSPRSLDAAKAAAGGCVALTRAVAEGDLRAGLALVRPPGHHAEANTSGGFCLLNNVALAAAAARTMGLRPAIFDFDVHHGNGTQWIFYEDPDVLVISIHRLGPGFYPGSGAATERGQGRGEGTNLNLPLSRGSGIQQYLELTDGPASRAVDDFSPDILLVSAGFDAHRDDPMGGMELTDEDFGQLIQRAAAWARRHCRGRWVAVLEGGYDPGALKQGTVSLATCLLSG